MEYIPWFLFAMLPLGAWRGEQRLKVNFAFKVLVYQVIGVTRRFPGMGRRFCIRRTSARN
jgi:hypothetical protein